MTLSRKVTSALAAAVAVAGVSWGVAAQAATVPPGTPPGAAMHMRNVSDVPTWYPLHAVDPFTGRFGFQPLGNGLVSHVRWTRVTPTEVDGTGQWDTGFMGHCQNGPVSMSAHGSGYKYTSISVTLTQNWTTEEPNGNHPCPAYGHGAHHSTAHVHLAVNDPTLNLDHF